MMYGIILYIVVCCAEFSKGLLEQENPCGTLTVAQPAIDGKYVLLTFIPNIPVDDQTKVEWKFKSTGYISWGSNDISNSTKYLLSSRNTNFTMDLYCDKKEVDKREFSATLITKTEECQSVWIKIDVLDAPASCGILYSDAKNITPNDTVVLEYYPPRQVLSEAQYIRQLRRKTYDCTDQFGCPVNQTWFKEDYKNRNSVYLYTITGFKAYMGGQYLIQCTNRTRYRNRATNNVKLIIPVPPMPPTFLNTRDIDGCKDCIPVNYNTYADIKCQVLRGGTLPLTVKIVIDGEEQGICNSDRAYTTFTCTKYISSTLHLKEISCDAINEAISAPLSTSTKLYVVEMPWGPYFFIYKQSEEEVNIYCYSQKGRPAPKLTMLIDGNLINTTNVPKEDPKKHIKLTHLQRGWNGAKIECCMHHPYYDEPNCSEKRINYFFSPATVNLTVSKPKPSDTGSFLQTLQCTIINANPACRVKWNHTEGALVTIGKDNITRTPGQGGYTTVSKLKLNGIMEINGTKIYCQPICDKFETNLVAMHTIHSPYPPILSINTSDQNTCGVGDTIVFACDVESYFPVNVTWYTSKKKTLDTFSCAEGAVCLRLDRIQEQDAGTYICEAASEYFNMTVQSVALNIESTDKHISERREKTPPWTIIGIGAGVGVVVLVLLTIFVLKRRRKTDKHETAHDDLAMDALNDQPVDTEPGGEQNGAHDHDPENEATYANTTYRDQNDGENIAVAGPSSLKTEVYTHKPEAVPDEKPMDTKDIENNSAVQSGTSELVYADLDLPAESETSTNPVISSAEQQTEYVSIDFNKVGEQLPEPLDIEPENIYANQ